MYISCLTKKNFSYWFQSLAQSKPHTTPLWQTVIAKGGWPQATEGRVGALSKKHFWHSLKIPKLTLNHKWRRFLNSLQGWVEHSLSWSYPRGKLHTVPHSLTQWLWASYLSYSWVSLFTWLQYGYDAACFPVYVTCCWVGSSPWPLWMSDVHNILSFKSQLL